MSRAQAIVRELGDRRLWTGHSIAKIAAEPTGFAALDQVLPGHGWPLGALTELIPQVEGIGELSLTLPALARLSARGKRIAFIAPPYIPYAPALVRAGIAPERVLWLPELAPDDAGWSAVQMLKSGAVGAVLLWTRRLSDTELRRIQLGAENGSALCFCYRPAPALKQASIASVRLALRPGVGGLRVDVQKAKGGRQGADVLCPLRERASLFHVETASSSSPTIALLASPPGRGRAAGAGEGRTHSQHPSCIRPTALTPAPLPVGEGKSNIH
ncbi:MAG TPA: translesion DNA synthesis-associated protein ImuA [Nevskiaceae bacterium]|nr:translesion DNA synthesis-associated protein ImuA [Nevskiaceae bacterium]